MHLDPDFDCLTYGDVGGRRGAGMVGMSAGDLLVFYGGLRPVHECEHRLIYALMGMYVVHEVVPAADVPPELWHSNAHVRKVKRGTTTSWCGRSQARQAGSTRCIPIGEWRNRSYRVRNDVLDAWGGLSVKDGFIQRSAVPPAFTSPEKFLSGCGSRESGSLQGTTDMAKSFSIHLRRPDCRTRRSGGTTRSTSSAASDAPSGHSRNLFHPRNASKLEGARLALVQGGKLGSRRCSLRRRSP